MCGSFKTQASGSRVEALAIRVWDSGLVVPSGLSWRAQSPWNHFCNVRKGFGVGDIEWDAGGGGALDMRLGFRVGSSGFRFEGQVLGCMIGLDSIEWATGGGGALDMWL